MEEKHEHNLHTNHKKTSINKDYIIFFLIFVVLALIGVIIWLIMANNGIENADGSIVVQLGNPIK